MFFLLSDATITLRITVVLYLAMWILYEMSPYMLTKAALVISLLILTVLSVYFVTHPNDFTLTQRLNFVLTIAQSLTLMWLWLLQKHARANTTAI